VEFTKKDGPAGARCGPAGMERPDPIHTMDGREHNGMVQLWRRGVLVRPRAQGGPPSQYAQNWYYNSEVGTTHGSSTSGRRQVGFFVTPGIRGQGGHAVGERSNVVVVPFPTTAERCFRSRVGAPRFFVFSCLRAGADLTGSAPGPPHAIVMSC